MSKQSPDLDLTQTVAQIQKLMDTVQQGLKKRDVEDTRKTVKIIKLQQTEALLQSNLKKAEKCLFERECKQKWNKTDLNKIRRSFT